MQCVADAAQYGRVNVIVVQIGGRYPCGLGGFIVGGQLSGNRVAVETDVHGHAHFSVRVGDAVARVTEDADEPGQFNREPGLFKAFTDRASGHRLVPFQAAGRDRPPARVGTAKQEQFAAMIAEYHASRGLACRARRRFRIVPIVGPPWRLPAHDVPASTDCGVRADAQTRSNDST